MVKIYALPTYGIGQTAIDALARSLPDTFKKRVDKTNNKELRAERAGAYALLKKALSDSGYNGNHIITESSLGRPILADLEGSFSISHTEGLSIVAVSDNYSVGIDTERDSSDKALRMKPLEERFLKGYKCSHSPLSDIAKTELFECDAEGNILPAREPSCSSASDIYRWVCAEATLKCEGGGFSSLCLIGSIAEQTDLYASVIEIDGGSYHVALAVKK